MCRLKIQRMGYILMFDLIIFLLIIANVFAFINFVIADRVFLRIEILHSKFLMWSVSRKVKSKIARR